MILERLKSMDSQNLESQKNSQQKHLFHFTGASKLASEQLILEYGNSFDFPVWINRCGVLAGAGQFGKADQGIFSYWIHLQGEKSFKNTLASAEQDFRFEMFFIPETLFLC